MKSTYEARATKFARVLALLFAGCSDLEDFEYAVECYNECHTRKLTLMHGVSRIAIVRSDYVIKCDMIPRGSFRDGSAGNCHSEQRVYARAVADGFDYLLAKTTLVEVEGREFAIMPRIAHVDDESRWWGDYCDYTEMRWLNDNIGDLHEGNLGYRRGKVCVIDYAWDEVEDRVTRTTTEEMSSPFSGYQY